jgi:hypothetical protein
MKAVSNIKRRGRSNRRIVRVLIAGAAVGAICGFLFGGGAASADGAKPGNPPAAVTGVATTSIVPGSRTVTPRSALNIVKLEAAPTGQGPAEEEECNEWAKSINQLITLKNNAASSGNLEKSLDYAILQDQYTDEAQDRGCYVVQ